jgi:uncharacterized protein
MSEDALIGRLRSLSGDIRQLGVRRLTLFGPHARGEGKAGSEVHFLLELEPPLTFEHYLQVRDYLVGVLARPVELVMESAEHPQIWEMVGEDAITLVGDGPFWGAHPSSKES